MGKAPQVVAVWPRVPGKPLGKVLVNVLNSGYGFLHLGADLNLYMILHSGEDSGQDLCMCVSRRVWIYTNEKTLFVYDLVSRKASGQGLCVCHSGYELILLGRP